jgi:hypothetical protein
MVSSCSICRSRISISARRVAASARWCSICVDEEQHAPQLCWRPVLAEEASDVVEGEAEALQRAQAVKSRQLRGSVSPVTRLRIDGRWMNSPISS